MDDCPKPGVTPTQLLMLMGLLFAFGLLVGAGFAYVAEEMVIAWALVAAAVVDGIAFAFLWRLNPLSSDAAGSGLGEAQRQAMVAELERRHAAGEVDTAAIERAKRALQEEP